MLRVKIDSPRLIRSERIQRRFNRFSAGIQTGPVFPMKAADPWNEAWPLVHSPYPSVFCLRTPVTVPLTDQSALTEAFTCLERPAHP